MKNLFSRQRREPVATREPVLESRRLQEREENERFLRQLYANQDPHAAAAEAAPDAAPDAFGARPFGVEAAATQDVPAEAQAEPAPPAAAQQCVPASADTQETDREGTRAALELLDVARQLLEGRDDVESRVARQLVARALELIPPVGAGRR